MHEQETQGPGAVACKNAKCGDRVHTLAQIPA